MKIENCTNEFSGIYKFPNCTTLFNKLVWNPKEKSYYTSLTEPSIIVYLKGNTVFDVFSSINPSLKIAEDKEILRDIDYVVITPVRNDFDQNAPQIINSIKQA